MRPIDRSNTATIFGMYHFFMTRHRTNTRLLRSGDVLAHADADDTLTGIGQ